MNDNYADFPKSITEIRADREDNGSLWTPRDSLIAALRAIDSGEWTPDAAVLIFRIKGEDGSDIKFFQATPDPDTKVGIIYRALHTVV